MNTVLIFVSMTEALKAKRLMNGNRIKARVIRLEGESDEGCKNGLIVENSSYYSAVDLLHKEGISFKVKSNDIPR